jgi:hypothetical protein
MFRMRIDSGDPELAQAIADWEALEPEHVQTVGMYIGGHDLPVGIDLVLDLGACWNCRPEAEAEAEAEGSHLRFSVRTAKLLTHRNIAAN